MPTACPRLPDIADIRRHPQKCLFAGGAGFSALTWEPGEVFHTYSAFARGLDHSAPGYPFLDLTPYGRQEKWEDSPAGWPQGVDAVGVPMDEQ